MLQGHAQVKVMPDHLELLMEHRLPHTRLLKKWILWLQCFKGWTHRTFSYVRSRVNWPALFLGSMLKVVQVHSLLYFLLMHSCLFLVSIFIYFYWSRCLFIDYLMNLESNYIYISYSFFFFSLVWFLFFISLLHCHFRDQKNIEEIELLKQRRKWRTLKMCRSKTLNI